MEFKGIYEVRTVGQLTLTLEEVVGEWYLERFKLVPQELVNMTKDVDSYIPTSVAEYIEHLELREEALEQLVSDLVSKLDSIQQQADTYMDLQKAISEHSSLGSNLQTSYCEDLLSTIERLQRAYDYDVRVLKDLLR